MRLSCVLCLCCFAIQSALATSTNLTLTVDGVTYSNVTLGTVTPLSVSFRHKTGAASVPLAKLPPELQKQLGYDPEKAAAYTEQQAETAAAYTKQQAETAAAYTKQQEEKTKRDAELGEKPEDVEIDALPFPGGETRLVAIKADPQKYIGRPVTIVGCVNISNSYYAGYNGAENEYYCLRFRELDAKADSTGEGLDLYLSRKVGQPLIDRLVKRSGKCRAIRAQVRITERSFESGHYYEMAEVVNWAFLSADRQSWNRWELANPK